jgi:hypothetical protein
MRFVALMNKVAKTKVNKGRWEYFVTEASRVMKSRGSKLVRLPRWNRSASNVEQREPMEMERLSAKLSTVMRG